MYFTRGAGVMGSRLASTAARRVPTQPICRSVGTSSRTRRGTGFFSTVYGAFFKSNVNYITAVVIALVGAEVMYGKFTDYVWESNNRGRLYHHIDWSKFKTEEEEEEDEEEEAEEGEGAEEEEAEEGGAGEDEE